jgi:hypothetical protein
MIERLIAVPLRDDGRYAGGVSRWLQQDVLPQLKAAVTLEATLIAAVSGPASADEGADAPITWEGQQYRLDLGFAERRRLERVRQKQEAVLLDAPLNIAQLARDLSSESVSAADIESAASKLAALARGVPRAWRGESTGAPLGVGLPDLHDTLRKAADELSRLAKGRDVKRASRVAESLIEASDDLLAQALLSFAYALNVGDPDGTVLLAGDVSYRHDFGFGLKDNTLRARATWSIPRQEVAPNTPWHVTGSLLGLDLGLAPLALRRMSFDRAMRAPKLTSTERETFAASVALMNAYTLRDADRDEIVDAIARGRARVTALPGMPDQFDAIADQLQMDGWRRRTLRWMLAHEAGGVASMFSMTELLFLGGGGSIPTLDSWGMSAVSTRGCICAQMARPGLQWSLAGRPQLGIVSAGVPDLTLHVATVLKQLQVPAALAKTVLSAAVQDFIDDVEPSDDGDWLTLSRAAQTLTREQVEDYLAAATADGPLVPLPIKSSQPGAAGELGEPGLLGER